MKSVSELSQAESSHCDDKAPPGTPSTLLTPPMSCRLKSSLTLIWHALNLCSIFTSFIPRFFAITFLCCRQIIWGMLLFDDFTHGLCIFLSFLTLTDWSQFWFSWFCVVKTTKVSAYMRLRCRENKGSLRLLELAHNSSTSLWVKHALLINTEWQFVWSRDWGKVIRFKLQTGGQTPEIPGVVAAKWLIRI